MKKIISGILLITMLCCLTACGGSPINGTWTYSLNGDTSTLRFSGTDKVVWTLEEDGEKEKYEGKYSLDEENGEITIVLTGWGSGTYDVSLSSVEQIDFIGLPHRKK